LLDRDLHLAADGVDYVPPGKRGYHAQGSSSRSAWLRAEMSA
jgi:hypothetical protein